MTALKYLFFLLTVFFVYVDGTTPKPRMTCHADGEPAKKPGCYGCLIYLWVKGRNQGIRQLFCLKEHEIPVVYKGVHVTLNRCMQIGDVVVHWCDTDLCNYECDPVTTTVLPTTKAPTTVKESSEETDEEDDTAVAGVVSGAIEYPLPPFLPIALGAVLWG